MTPALFMTMPSLAVFTKPSASRESRGSVVLSRCAWSHFCSTAPAVCCYVHSYRKPTPLTCKRRQACVQPLSYAARPPGRSSPLISALLLLSARRRRITELPSEIALDGLHLFVLEPEIIHVAERFAVLGPAKILHKRLVCRFRSPAPVQTVR